MAVRRDPQETSTGGERVQHRQLLAETGALFFPLEVLQDTASRDLFRIIGDRSAGRIEKSTFGQLPQPDLFKLDFHRWPLVDL